VHSTLHSVLLRSIDLITTSINSLSDLRQLRSIELITTSINSTGDIRLLRSINLISSSLISTIVRLRHVSQLFYRYAQIGRRLFPSRLAIRVIQRVARPQLLPPPVSGSMLDFCWLRRQADTTLHLRIGRWWLRVLPSSKTIVSRLERHPLVGGYIIA